MNRILPPALPAPALVEAILGGWVDQRVMLENPERPVGWEEQRAIRFAVSGIPLAGD